MQGRLVVGAEQGDTKGHCFHSNELRGTLSQQSATTYRYCPGMEKEAQPYQGSNIIG